MASTETGPIYIGNDIIRFIAAPSDGVSLTQTKFILPVAVGRCCQFQGPDTLLNCHRLGQENVR